MKYELEILVPFCNEGVFAARLENFKKFGVFNSGNTKILVKALVGTEVFVDLEKGWPDNVDVEVITCDLGKHPASKVYDYYASVDVDSLQSEWYMRVDDDGYTDISALMDELNRYSYQKNYYFATFSHNLWLEVLERGLLFDMGYSEEAIEEIRHEHECCVNSLASVEKILQSKEARKLFKIRSEIPLEVCDRCWGCGAFIAEEKTIQVVSWLSRDSHVLDFSYLGGLVCHTHGMVEDKLPWMWFVFSHCISYLEEMGHDEEGTERYFITMDGKSARMALKGVCATVRHDCKDNFADNERRNMDNVSLWVVDEFDNLFLCNLRGEAIIRFNPSVEGIRSGTQRDGFGVWEMRPFHQKIL